MGKFILGLLNWVKYVSLPVLRHVINLSSWQVLTSKAKYYLSSNRGSWYTSLVVKFQCELVHVGVCDCVSVCVHVMSCYFIYITKKTRMGLS